MVSLDVKEYINIEFNWLLTEIQVNQNGVMIDRRLQIVDMDLWKRIEGIDDVWKYNWREI